MEPVETRSLPCEECNHTGHCESCGGTGKDCFCKGGKCIFCDGLGKISDFYYQGSPISIMVDLWWRMMLVGVVFIALGVMFTLIKLLALGKSDWDFDPLWFAIAVLAFGTGFLAWSIRLWKLKRLVKEAEEAFNRMQSIGLHG